MAEKFTTDFAQRLHAQALDRPKGKQRGGDIVHADHIEQGKSLILRKSYGGRMTWKVLFYVTVKDERSKAKIVARAKKLGRYPDMSVKQAYTAARNFNHHRASAAASSDTFGKIANDWFAVRVGERKLRSGGEIRRHLDTYVLPLWKDENIYDLRLSRVNDLLDRIKDRKIQSPGARIRKSATRGGRTKLQTIGGPSQADAVLATVRAIMVWWSTKDENYTCPIDPRMNLKRDGRSSEEKQRKRVLTDDEIRALWSGCDQLGNPGALVRLLLLTGQRLRKVANIKWGDVADGNWTINTESREKGNAGEVRLPQIAVDLIDEQHRIDGNDYIFPAARGSGPINSFAQLKRDFDKLMPADTPNWRFHDLRRTARTRMAELDIDDRIAELTLGHKIKGVEAVYNRAKLTERKSRALQELADHITGLLNVPQPSNVVMFPKKLQPLSAANAG